MPERFTIRVNSNGERVEKPLAEMTAAEVIEAVEWLDAEARQLDGEAMPFHALAKRTIIASDENRAEFEVAKVGLGGSVAAAERQMRLMALIEASMPQWKGSRRSLKGALKKWWPGGVA